MARLQFCTVLAENLLAYERNIILRDLDTSDANICIVAKYVAWHRNDCTKTLTTKFSKDVAYLSNRAFNYFGWTKLVEAAELISNIITPRPPYGFVFLTLK